MALKQDKCGYGSLVQEAEDGGIGGSEKRSSLSRIHPWLYIAAFVTIYPANNTVLTMLLSRGAPFTVCNILCTGNIIGVLTLIPVFHRHLTTKQISSVTPSQWAWILASAVFANVLGSLFYLEGLAQTSVPATALMHRLESVNYLIAAALFLNEKLSLWVAFTALLTLLGVVAAIIVPVYLQGQSFGAFHGYLYLLLGGWGYTVSLLITKKYLVDIKMGILATSKVIIGTILFHILAVIQDGTGSMGTLYSLPLWLTMLWYGPLFVTSTYFLWLRAVKYCKPTVLSVGMNLNFVNTIVWSVLLLHKWPSLGESVGGILIVFSIISGTLETCYQPAPSSPPSVGVGTNLKDMESEGRDLLESPSIQQVGQGLAQQLDFNDTDVDAKILKY